LKRFADQPGSKRSFVRHYMCIAPTAPSLCRAHHFARYARHTGGGDLRELVDEFQPFSMPAAAERPTAETGTTVSSSPCSASQPPPPRSAALRVISTTDVTVGRLVDLTLLLSDRSLVGMLGSTQLFRRLRMPEGEADAWVAHAGFPPYILAWFGP